MSRLLQQLSQLIHLILETHTNDNSELDYDKIVTLATFGLIILSSTDNTFVDKIYRQILSTHANIMADYYLYDKLEPYLIRRNIVDKDIPLIEVIYEFGTEMGNTHIDFSNIYKTDGIKTQTSLFDGFNSIARVLYQSVFCCKLVEIKDVNTKKSIRSNIEQAKSYLNGIFKIIDKRKSKIIPKYRFVYYDGTLKPQDSFYKSKTPIEKALDSTAYIFKKSSILPSIDPKGGISLGFTTLGLIENANSFFIKPLNDIQLDLEIKKKTHGLQKQIIIVENFDESVIVPPPNIETVIISIDNIAGGTRIVFPKPTIKYIKQSPNTTNPKYIKLSYNGCSLKKYNCNEDRDDITDYTYDNGKPEHREETIEHVVLNEVNVIINAINDVDTAMEEPVFSSVLSSTLVPLSAAPSSAVPSSTSSSTFVSAVYPIAVIGSKGEADGIYDPTLDMKNDVTIYKKRNDKDFTMFFEDSYWKIVEKQTILISRNTTPGDQRVLPNTLKNWTNNIEVIDLKTYFEKTRSITDIMFLISKMTTMRIIRDNQKFATLGRYQCEKEGEYINIPKNDNLVPYGLAKIRRFVVNPFVYMGALIYDSVTNETWGKGICTYENGDKYTGNVKFTDKEEILPNGEGILVYENGDVCNGDWNEFNCTGGTYTDRSGNTYNIL